MLASSKTETNKSRWSRKVLGKISLWKINDHDFLNWERYDDSQTLELRLMYANARLKKSKANGFDMRITEGNFTAAYILEETECSMCKTKDGRSIFRNFKGGYNINE